MLYDDILDIDVLGLKKAIEGVEAINQEYRISSDTFNLICMYLIHRFLTTPMLEDSKREKAAIDCALIFNYRTISAIMMGWFKYPVDPKLAQATYANLSYRFLIKKLGSWQEVMLYRAKDLVGEESIHREAFVAFTDDYATVRIVNDARGRITDMVKNIYAEMMRANKDGEKIHTTSSVTIDADGEEIIRDKIHGLQKYTSYLLSVLHDRDSFIKQELVQIVSKIMFTMQVRGFTQTLEWMSHESGQLKHPEIEVFVKLILTHSYNYLLANGHQVGNMRDISGLLGKLKGAYVSSRTSEPDLLKLREMGTEIVKVATGKSNEQSIAAIRTGLFLYVSLRAFTKHHYSSA